MLDQASLDEVIETLATSKAGRRPLPKAAQSAGGELARMPAKPGAPADSEIPGGCVDRRSRGLESCCLFL